MNQFSLASYGLILALFVYASTCYAITDFCAEFLKHHKYDQAIEACSSQIRGNTSSEKLVYAYYRRGSAYMAKGERDLAILDYNKVIELNPQFYSAYNQRGLINHFKGKYEDAVSDFTIAIKLQQKDAENIFAAYANRGNAFKAIGMFEKAIADYNKAADLNLKIPNVLYNLSCAYSLAKKTPEACATLQRAIDNGYANWNNVKNDRELDNIRDATCYKKIIVDK